MKTTIRVRLLILQGLACAALLLLSGYAMWQLHRLAGQMAASSGDLIAAQRVGRDLGSAATAFKTQVQEWKNILIRGNDKAAYDRHLEGFTKEEKLTREALELLGKQAADVGLDPALVAKALASHAQLGDNYRKALQGFDATDPESGKKTDVAVRGMDRALGQALDELSTAVLALTEQRSREDVARGAAAAANASTFLIAGSLVLLALMGVSGWWISRSILLPIRSLEATALEIEAQRNLARRVGLAGRDEIALAARAFDAMLARFQSLVGDINQRSGTVARQSDAIASALNQLGSAADSQSGATASVSSAVEQLTVSIAQVEEAAREARTLAERTLTAARSSRGAVQETTRQLHRVAERVSAMANVLEELGQRSSAISGIVQTVKEIADQTNLLALNAAIEAARAGEQGRGFAVVADEVRKLAEKTTGSTEEIATLIRLIQDSASQAIADVRELSAGFGEQVRSAEQADASIVDIEQAVGEVNQVSSRISEALAEQSSASLLISQQVERIAQMSDEAHQAINDVSRGTQQLDAASQELAGQVASFRV